MFIGGENSSLLSCPRSLGPELAIAETQERPTPQKRQVGKENMFPGQRTEEMVHFLIMPLSQGSTEHPSSGAFSAVLQDVDNRQEGGPAQPRPAPWSGGWESGVLSLGQQAPASSPVKQSFHYLAWLS